MLDIGDENLEPLPIPEPLSGEETAEIVSQIYETVSPKVISRFVEANIVLTLEGARGQTEFFIDYPTEEDKHQLNQISTLLESRGIRTKHSNKTFKSPSTGIETLMISLDSLRGYERVSKISHVPGVIPFEAAGGWEGESMWWQKVWRRILCLILASKN